MSVLLAGCGSDTKPATAAEQITAVGKQYSALAAISDNIGISKIDADRFTVSDIKIKGDRATANVTPTVADEDPARRFVREGGAWKLDVDPA